ncbi:hypothetical protein Ancab_007312 [Ancistrocladus abbreviatus]
MHNRSFEDHGFVDDTVPPDDLHHYSLEQVALGSCISSNVDYAEVPDYSDACLKFINGILMEEDVDDKPAALQDRTALQATEKSLYDALGETYPSSSDQVTEESLHNVLGVACLRSSDHFLRFSGLYGGSCSSHESSTCLPSESIVSTNRVLNQSNACHSLESCSQSSVSPVTFDDDTVSCPAESSSSSLTAVEVTGEGNFRLLGKVTTHSSSFTFTQKPKGNERINGAQEEKNNTAVAEDEKKDGLFNELSGRHRERDDLNVHEVRSNKYLAAYTEDYAQMEQYDDILLRKEGMDDVPCTNGMLQNETIESLEHNGNTRRLKGRTKRGKRNSDKEAVDLTSLLTQCAQAVAGFDLRSTNELLKQIRQHSSHRGNSIQRVAHYFANGLEARIAGTGSQLFIDLINSRVPFSESLKAYKSYVSAVPVSRTSFFIANQTIAKLAEKATRIHIIDFGIFLGFQWPSLIQQLSERALGPPKLRITGIDFPQDGFRPAEKLEETGRRLTRYCERFRVPFEYQAIAQTWETIHPEDLKVDRDELLVVNSQYRSTTLLDETVDVNCPRDAFLKLIRKLNPDLFIYAIVNGTHSIPFFTTRFREALFHYSSVFDMLEATMLLDDHERWLFESELHGKEILSVVACEGVERVYRPETYKRWQGRLLRAGLRQIPLDQELVNQAKAVVKANYHKDIVVDEDHHWMLQGWKGRIFFALSCWKPA